jgi:hypothetical protein
VDGGPHPGQLAKKSARRPALTPLGRPVSGLSRVRKPPSGLNQLKCRVEAFQLDAGLGGCKAPVSFDIVSIAVEEPGGNLALETAPIRDTPIETLIGQDSELRLGHIEPAWAIPTKVSTCTDR